MPTDSRIKTFIYSPNEVFQVKFMLNYQSIIELAKDEDLELISLKCHFGITICQLQKSK